VCRLTDEAVMIERLHLDKALFYALIALSVLSLAVIYSASGKSLTATGAHAVRLLLGFGVMIALAQVRPETLERWSPVVFGAGLALTLAVLALGVIGKGAQRWLSLGILRFQPSEIMKLAVPMMLAWFFAREGLPPRLWRVAVGLIVTFVPAAIIAKQPDLGTAALVFLGGVIVIFLAGLSWRVIIPIVVLAAAATPFAWHFMHDYQRERIITLFDPQSDPLGRGYHTLQSMIAVGSGGFYGKGWLNSTQAHLDYLPESHTDFIFAVFAEEFGLIGSMLLVGLYTFVTARCLWIAYTAQDTYTRLVSGGLALAFFVHFFINMGMVVGILPVVGIPLPILSYGGTSIVTLMAAFGVLMGIHTHRKIVEA
jgi:rod shape determining protein RodA